MTAQIIYDEVMTKYLKLAEEKQRWHAENDGTLDFFNLKIICR